MANASARWRSWLVLGESERGHGRSDRCPLLVRSDSLDRELLLRGGAISRGRSRTAAGPAEAEAYLGQRAVDQVRRDEWNAHDRSHTKAGKWIKGTR